MSTPEVLLDGYVEAMLRQPVRRADLAPERTGDPEVAELALLVDRMLDASYQPLHGLQVARGARWARTVPRGSMDRTPWPFRLARLYGRILTNPRSAAIALPIFGVAFLLGVIVTTPNSRPGTPLYQYRIVAEDARAALGAFDSRVRARTDVADVRLADVVTATAGGDRPAIEAASQAYAHALLQIALDLSDGAARDLSPRTLAAVRANVLHQTVEISSVSAALPVATAASIQVLIDSIATALAEVDDAGAPRPVPTPAGAPFSIQTPVLTAPPATTPSALDAPPDGVSPLLTAQAGPGSIALVLQRR